MFGTWYLVCVCFFCFQPISAKRNVLKWSIARRNCILARRHFATWLPRAITITASMHVYLIQLRPLICIRHYAPGLPNLVCHTAVWQSSTLADDVTSQPPPPGRAWNPVSRHTATNSYARVHTCLRTRTTIHTSKFENNCSVLLVIHDGFIIFGGI